MHEKGKNEYMKKRRYKVVWVQSGGGGGDVAGTEQTNKRNRIKERVRVSLLQQNTGENTLAPIGQRPKRSVKKAR